MWFLLGPAAKLTNNVTDPALLPFRLTSRSKSVDKSHEEFPKELMEDWSTMEVCVDCKKFISEIINSSRRSLSLANKRARLKRKTQSFYMSSAGASEYCPSERTINEIWACAFCFASAPRGHHPSARSLGLDRHPVALFHLTGLGLPSVTGFPAPAAPRDTELCWDLCRAVHDRAAARTGRDQQLEIGASFVRVRRNEKAFSRFQSFFNHALNHFSGDELRAGVWWRTRASTVSALAH